MSLVLKLSQLPALHSYNLNPNEKYAVGNLENLAFFKIGPSYYLGYPAGSKFSKALMKQLKKEAKPISHQIEGKNVSFFAGKAGGYSTAKLAKKNGYSSVADWWKAKQKEITVFVIPVGSFLIHIKPDGRYTITREDGSRVYESPIYGLFRTDPVNLGDPSYTSYFTDSFVFPLYRIPQ